MQTGQRVAVTGMLVSGALAVIKIVAGMSGHSTAVVADHCPFGDAASRYPVLCAVDRGMVKGLLAGLCGEDSEGSVPVVLSSRARGDDACTALV